MLIAANEAVHDRIGRIGLYSDENRLAQIRVVLHA